MNRLSTCLACAILIADGRPLWAQTGQPARQPVPAEAAQPIAHIAPEGMPAVFNMSFQGGSVAQYVEALRLAAGSANVMVMPDAARVDLPAVTLTGVSLQSAVNVLDGRAQQTADRVVTLVVGAFGGAGGVADLIFTVDAKIGPVPGRGPRPTSDTQVSRVWALNDIIEAGVKAEDALTAIETSLGQYPQATAHPDIKFHKETRLLLARGAIDQLESIGGVIDTLGGSTSSGKTRSDVANLATKIASLEKRVESLQRQLEGAAEKKPQPGPQTR